MGGPAAPLSIFLSTEIQMFKTDIQINDMGYGNNGAAEHILFH